MFVLKKIVALLLMPMSLCLGVLGAGFCFCGCGAVLEWYSGCSCFFVLTIDTQYDIVCIYCVSSFLFRRIAMRDTIFRTFLQGGLGIFGITFRGMVTERL